MMFPKDGKYVCNSCGATQDIGTENVVIRTSSKNKEMKVISDEAEIATLPKTRILCPECGHTEATFTIRQTRAADEPETRIYRCTKCNHTWREYRGGTMFVAELKSDTLKGLVNIISTLIDEVKFTVTAEGMTLKAVDAAHVAMIEMNVGKGAFESYSASDCEMGLDLDKVKGVLKLAGSGDIIRMEQDESAGRLVFKVGNITRRMNLVDTSSLSDPKVPHLELSSNISVAVDELQKGIRAAESISDHITLTATPEYFDLSCEGDTDSSSLRLDKSAVKELDVSGQATSMFPLDYFSNIIKAIPGGTVVKIGLDNDYPVKLMFGLADDNAKVEYLLAPRIENE